MTNSSSGDITIGSMLQAMEKLQSIPKPRPTVVQCLERDKSTLIESCSSKIASPLYWLTVGFPVRFYVDKGEMASEAFDLINDGFSVLQLKTE